MMQILSALHDNFRRGQTFTFCRYMYSSFLPVFGTEKQHCFAVKELLAVRLERFERQWITVADPGYFRRAFDFESNGIIR